MTALEGLLTDLSKLGVQLRVDGEHLRYTAPQALTPLLREQLRAHKPDLIAHLRNGLTANPAEPQQQIYPPSFVQRRFWTLQQLNPGEPFYNVPFVFRIRGKLDVALLRQSFNAIARRHEVLRTTLQQINGELLQVVAPHAEIPLTVSDAQDGAAAESLLRAGMERPFDLANEPGLRVLLIECGDQDYLLQLCLHNTLFDQNSLMVLLDELSRHYAALATGRPAMLAPPTQYAEYQRWQESLVGSGSEERLQYWREWFSSGPPPQWTWQSGKPATSVTGAFESHVTWQHCSPELTRSLKTLSQQNGVTLFITLFAAYVVTLRKYTNCPDLTIGTTYSNRHHWGFDSLIGATIDVPALRVNTTNNPQISELLAQVRGVMAAALTHQDVPFERVAPSLNLPPRPAGPLFRMVFTFFGDTPHSRLRLPDADVTFLEDRINESSRPDLYLVFWENSADAGEPRLTGYWMHKKSAFTAETATRMNDDFRGVLAEMVRDSSQTLSSLAVAQIQQDHAR